MRNDGVRDLHLAVAWSCRRLEKLLALDPKCSEVTYWFAPDTSDEKAPPLGDQVLALSYLENQQALEIGQAVYRNELYNRVGAPEMFGAKSDGYRVEIVSKSFERICKELRPLIDKLGVYLVRADHDFNDLKQPILVFENKGADFYVEFSGERVSIKQHSRQFGLLAALKEQRGRHLPEKECIEAANHYVTKGKTFITGKDIYFTLRDIKKKLKVGKSCVFPIELENNQYIWRK